MAEEREYHWDVGCHHCDKCLANRPGASFLSPIYRILAESLDVRSFHQDSSPKPVPTYRKNQNTSQNPSHGDKDSPREEQDQTSLLGGLQGGFPKHRNRDCQEVQVSENVQYNCHKNVDLGNGRVAKVCPLSAACKVDEGGGPTAWVRIYLPVLGKRPAAQKDR